MLRVGILGAGGMGNVHARQYRKMPDVDLVFFDPDEARRAKFQTTWQCAPVDSEEDVLRGCDVVDVCLPTDRHLEYGLKAISEGKAVFLEKPMAGSLDDAAQLIEAADRAGVPMMPGQVVRFFPEYREGRRMVVEGAVGRPAAARTRRGGLAPMGGAENWFMDHSRSGGVLLDLAVHDFDWLRWTLGEVDSLYARSLGATTGKGPDYGLTTMSFESGAVAHVESTWMDPSGSRTTFEVCGSAGMIEFDSRNTPTVRTHLAPPKEGDPPRRGGNEAPLTPTDDPYYRQLKGFLDAVRSGTPPPVSGYDGFMAVSLGLAALESARTGKVVVPAR
ncbi:MAG: Gfo/Idh/MocA family oxidoreductase [Fimbriimonadaceae bacterium]|nr:Gfo/Idh/MocA family oxidoreductase [Chthonomonadaceae bacterium]MCO5298235.1 Gfo/Idh/MocA family oxidoreductase [Fimbriimonadaceae bacterium]